MKHWTSVLRTFSLLNGALLFAGGSGFAQTSTDNSPAPLPPLASSRPTPSVVASAQTAPTISGVQVNVELLSLKSVKQQEFFGADEVFVMCMFSEMNPTSNSSVAPLVRAKNHFDVMWPAILKKGQTFNYMNSGGIVFYGYLPPNGSLSGQLRVMEEDVTRKWDISHLARNENILNSVNHDIRLLEHDGNGLNRKVTNEEMMRYATKHWNAVSHPNPGIFDDLDDVIDTMPLEVSASGAPTEEREWTANGDGATYTLKYRITRTPISNRTPTPAPETPAPVPTTPVPPVPTNPVPPVPTTPVPPVPTNPVPPVPTTPVPPVPTNPVPPVPTTPVPPLPTNPIPPIPTTPPSVPTGPRPGATEGFLPLRYFEVRVDKVAPNIAGDKLEVFCSFKNRTQAEQNINGSMIHGVVTDADGVGLIFRDFYRLTGEPELVGGNKAVAPGGEFKTRMLVDIPEGVSAFNTMTFWETSSLPQTVDISNVQWASVKPAANLSALKLQKGTNEFKACGKILDVRFEGFRKARDGSYEVVFTFKNTSEETTFDNMLEIVSSSLDVALHDADGQKEGHDQVLRPNGEKAIPMTHHVAIIAGGETKIRYRFRPGFVPTKLSIKDRPSDTTIEWPLVVSDL